MSATSIGNFEIHPAASLFPEMDAAQLQSLASDIKKSGIKVPVVVFQGKVLDGRNRLRAAIMAGVGDDLIPRRSLPDDTDPYAAVYSLNCERLAYSPTQRAELVVKCMKESGDLERIRLEAEERRRANLKQSTDAMPDRFRQVAESVSPAVEQRTDTAAVVARRAQTSVRTAERAIQAAGTASSSPTATVKPKTPKVPAPTRLPKKWSRDPIALAKMLQDELPSETLIKLTEELTRVVKTMTGQGG